MAEHIITSSFRPLTITDGEADRSIAIEDARATASLLRADGREVSWAPDIDDDGDQTGYAWMYLTPCDDAQP